MKNMFKKINISPFFYILIFISLLSGLFKDIIFLFLILLLHELGHIITSIIFKWKISKIRIGITGGYITYDNQIDKPFNEELLISISGIIMQVLIFLLTLLLHNNSIINDSLYILINKYNFAIIIFNLIPIYPLDGLKIVNVLLNLTSSYKSSLKMNFMISMFFISIIIIFFIFNKEYLEVSYLMIIIFLIKSNIKYYAEIPYLYNRFLLERYKYPVKVFKYNYIKNNNLCNMRRRRINYFYNNNRFVSEKVLLNNRFNTILY